MDEAKAAAAAALLIGHWKAGTRVAGLPPELRPASRADGYAIQAHWLRESRDPLFGWKIAATSAAGQKHINVDGPLAGRLLAERVLADGATVPLGNGLMRVAEVEFAFRFGRTLPPRALPYGVAEVIDAVASLHPAIEIPDTRFTDFCAVGAAQLIADNACADRFLLGPASAAPWRDVDLAAQAVSAEVAGRSAHDGVGSNALGDPRIALTWIVNELSGLGLAMHAGEVVTTGTCLVPIPVEPGDLVRARYGRFGELTVRFVA